MVKPRNKGEKEIARDIANEIYAEFYNDSMSQDQITLLDDILNFIEDSYASA